MTPAPFSPAHARTHGEIIRHWRTGQRWLEVTALGPDRRGQRPRRMRAPIANLDAMAGFSAPICSAVRSFRVQKKSENNACNTHRWVYRRGMKVTFSIATPSGVKVLGTSNGRQVRFSAVAHKLGYAAMMLKRAVLAQCEYLAAEPAAVSVETICGIKIERVA